MSTTTSNEFYTTKRMFISYISYTQPLSYDEWIALPDSHKAAALFVQFFPEITLAWRKNKSPYSLETDAVSEVLQYLTKNVSKIEKDPKRFKAPYIYKVAWNCLYCLCRDPNRHKKVFENERSNLVSCNETGDELDLFDTVVSNGDVYDQCNQMYSDNVLRNKFWELLDDVDSETSFVIAQLLGETVKGKKPKITEERKLEIIQNLRDTLVVIADQFDF